MWQDVALMVISLLFGVFLLPMLRDAFVKRIFPNWKSAATTAIGLYTCAVIYATLGLWLTTASTVLTGTIWMLLFVLRFRGLRVWE